MCVCVCLCRATTTELYSLCARQTLQINYEWNIPFLMWSQHARHRHTYGMYNIAVCCIHIRNVRMIEQSADSTRLYIKYIHTTNMYLYLARLHRSQNTHRRWNRNVFCICICENHHLYDCTVYACNMRRLRTTRMCNVHIIGTYANLYTENTFIYQLCMVLVYYTTSPSKQTPALGDAAACCLLLLLYIYMCILCGSAICVDRRDEDVLLLHILLLYK